MCPSVGRAVAVLLLSALAVGVGDNTSPPFADLARTAENQWAGWEGDKRPLAELLYREQNRLGGRFELELARFIGSDVQRHYWVAALLSSAEPAAGGKRRPYLALVILEQGVYLSERAPGIQAKADAVRMSIRAAVLSRQLGFQHLAIAHKSRAEALIAKHSELAGASPAMSAQDHKTYSAIAIPKGRPSL